MLKEWIVSASALTAAVLLLRLAFRRRVSQKLQYWLWLPVLLRLLVPVPLFRAPVSVSGAAAELAPAVFTTAAPAPAERPAATPRPSNTPQPTGSPAAPATAAPVTAAHAPTAYPTPAPTQPRQLNAAELPARLWLVGSLASGLWLLGVNLRFSGRLRASRRELGRQGKLPVYVSDAVASPCLFGLLRPGIYLTPACGEWPSQRRSQVLLHEETHWKQGDHVWGSLRCLALAVWWWNPLVWLAALCSRRDGELSCDERVMKRLGEDARMDYGRTLVDLLPSKAPRPLLSAATLSGGARAMKQRLERIVKKPKHWLIAAVAVLLLALAAVGCAFAGKPTESPKPAETPTPTQGPGEEWLLTDRTPEIDSIEYTLLYWETYTLRRGMEGFDEALEALLALRGTPCEDPPAGPSVKRTLDFGSGEVMNARMNLQFADGRVLGFTSGRWLDLSAMGRPDEELAAIFERYGERDVPEAVPANDRGRIEDGRMTAAAEYPTYDYGTIQAAIRQARDDYLAAGERKDPEAAMVKLILENRTGGAMNRGEVVLQALRDGQWMWLSTYGNYGSTGNPVDVPAEGTAEAWLHLPMYDDPLTPGRYRAAVYYGVPDENGLLDLYYERVAYAEFEIAEGAAGGPGDGTELLLPKTDRERVERIRYELPRWGETYYLYKGDEGFEEALDILFSLRGERCEEPQILTRRTVDLDPRVELAWDGDAVYGATNNGYRWLRLEGEGRPDQALGEIFERCAQPRDPIGEAADHSGLMEDSRLSAYTEQTVYDLNSLLAAIEESRAAYEEAGGSAYSEDAAISLTVENGLDQPVYYGGDSFFLEILLEGQWYRRWEYSRSYFGIAYALEPGERMTFPMPMEWFVRPLEAGRYRFVFTCDAGELGGDKYVAYAEFELADGGMPLFTPEPAPETGPAPVSEGEILAAYEAAREAFRWFEVSSLDDLSVDRTAVREEGIQRYYLITDPRFASWETLEAYLLSLFDDETVRARLSSGPFKEFDGRVYGFSADAGTDQTVGDRVGIRVVSQGEDRFVVSADYARLDLIMLNGESTGVTQVGVSTYEFPYVWQGDRWAFEGFRLVETYAGPLPEPGPSSFEPLTEAMGADWLPLSSGARRLTEEELAEWKAWFDGDWMRPQFLYSAYARPEDADLRELFYNGVDIWEESRTDYNVNSRNPVTEEDVRYILLHLGNWHWETDTDKLPRSQMDAVLQKYLGLGLEETNRVNLTEGGFPYLTETDSFYHMHGDTNAFFPTGFLGGYAFGEEIALFYSGTCPYYGTQFTFGYDYMTGVYRVKLRRTGEGVQFVSNLRVLTDGVNWTCEEPMPGPAVPADYSGDYGRDITVITPEPTVFGSYEEARAAENLDYVMGEEVSPFQVLLEKAYPGFGALVYGEVYAGLPHGPLSTLYFITEDGRRYALPTPQYGLGDYELDLERGGRGYELLDDDGTMVRWQFSSPGEMETYPALGIPMKKGGDLYYTLYLPTMEVFIWFSPEA